MPKAGDPWQRDVLPHRPLHEEGLRTIGRHVHKARPDGVGRMSERGRFAVNEDLAGRGTRGPGEDVEQLVLALPLQGDDPEHLARKEVERDIVQIRSSGEPLGRDAWLGITRPRRGRSPPCGVGQILDDLAEHELDDPVLRTFGDVDDTDRRALAEDGGPVAHRLDLDHPVGDEDDGAVAATLPTDHLEDSLGEVRRQSRGHLIKHQDVRLGGQGAGEVDDPERGERQTPRLGSQVELAKTELREPVAEGFQRCLCQPQVLPDVEVRDQ